jgi:hypothetical protein
MYNTEESFVILYHNNNNNNNNNNRRELEVGLALGLVLVWQLREK